MSQPTTAQNLADHALHIITTTPGLAAAAGTLSREPLHDAIVDAGLTGDRLTAAQVRELLPTVSRAVGLRTGDVFQDQAALYVVTGPGTGVRFPTPNASERPTAWDLSGCTGLTPVHVAPAAIAPLLASHLRIALPAHELQLIAQAVAAVAERAAREQATD